VGAAIHNQIYYCPKKGSDKQWKLLLRQKKTTNYKFSNVYSYRWTTYKIPWQCKCSSGYEKRGLCNIFPYFYRFYLVCIADVARKEKSWEGGIKNSVKDSSTHFLSKLFKKQKIVYFANFLIKCVSHIGFLSKILRNESP